MFKLRPLLPVLLGLCSLDAQSVSWSPAAGFVYPGGVQRGTTTRVMVGGRALGGVKEVRVSGEGVQARVIGTYRSLRNMNNDQRAVLQYMTARRMAELTGKEAPPLPDQMIPGKDGKPKPESEPPLHPLVGMLPTMTLPELLHWETFMKRGDRLQPARHLEETVQVEITVEPKARPGIRELRLMGNNGLSNPLRFQVGTLPEHRELEPNESPSAEPLRLPCLVNGQIQPGDMDRIRFHARGGQTLVIHASARSLIPYLADAVPGWFQMAMRVLDEDGREVAYADHFQHHPDPVLAFEVPAAGIYTLEIHDSIYRGRDDFVYRVAIGELPLVGSRYPLGGQAGQPLEVELRGWNLRNTTLQLDSAPDGPLRRRVEVPDTHGFEYEIDSLPEVMEREPNEDSAMGLKLQLPCVANGRIDQPGDADIYLVDGRAGQPFAIEVAARRLGSPLDAVVHVATSDGQVLTWQDDFMSKDGHLHLGDGLLTHHADPQLLVDPPADGPLWIRIADTRRYGGPSYGYRLKVMPLQPDFELRVSPSGLTTAAGRHTPFSVHVLRRHGFDGEIRLNLENAPGGFGLSGAVIPAGSDSCQLTLDAPVSIKAGAYTPRLTGTAVIAGERVTRDARPADDRMQAFLWRHLVEAEEWLVLVQGKSGPIKRIGEGWIELPAGGSTTVDFEAWKDLAPRISSETSSAPEGLSITQPRGSRNGFSIELRATEEMEVGQRFNLIVDLYSAVEGKRSAKVRFPNNSLPALPIVITPASTP